MATRTPGVFCLEGEWASRIEDRQSVLPVLEVLERQQVLRFRVRAICGYTKNVDWVDSAAFDLALLYNLALYKRVLRHLDASEPGRLVYRYGEDWKRPSPSVVRMAARHPELAFTHESCDEFGQGAHRLRYENGRETGHERVSPFSLVWVEWDDEDE